MPFTNSCWSIKLEKSICQYWGWKISSKRIFKEESWKGLTLDVHQIQSNFCINSVNWVEKFSPVVFKISQVKFGLSEKHTKFEKIFLMVLTNQLIYLVNVKTMRKIFFKLCVLLKKSGLYLTMYSADLPNQPKYLGCLKKALIVCP